MKTITTNMKAWRIAPLPQPIGFSGDNMVTRLEVVTNLEAGWQLKLDIQKYGNANVIDLTRDGTLFYVDLTADVLSFTGTASAQIRGLNGEKVAHSNQFDFTVRQSINAIDTFPPLEPTETAQLEARVTALKGLAETAKVGADQSATNAKQSEINAKASEDAAKLSEAAAAGSQAAAKISETNAKTSETKASTSEITASQALADLLALLGNKVATLGADGKLLTTQLPDLSINQSYLIVTPEDRLTLDCQTGDMAYMETAGQVMTLYWMVGVDPTQEASWKQLGLSFVANAGHANTADTATNADQINGHRMVEMSATDFATAVKDPSTYYLVFSGVV